MPVDNLSTWNTRVVSSRNTVFSALPGQDHAEKAFTRVHSAIFDRPAYRIRQESSFAPLLAGGLLSGLGGALSGWSQQRYDRALLEDKQLHDVDMTKLKHANSIEIQDFMHQHQAGMQQREHELRTRLQSHTWANRAANLRHMQTMEEMHSQGGSTTDLHNGGDRSQSVVSFSDIDVTDVEHEPPDQPVNLAGEVEGRPPVQP